MLSAKYRYTLTGCRIRLAEVVLDSCVHADFVSAGCKMNAEITCRLIYKIYLKLRIAYRSRGHTCVPAWLRSSAQSLDNLEMPFGEHASVNPTQWLPNSLNLNTMDFCVCPVLGKEATSARPETIKTLKPRPRKAGAKFPAKHATVSSPQFPETAAPLDNGGKESILNGDSKFRSLVCRAFQKIVGKIMHAEQSIADPANSPIWHPDAQPMGTKCTTNAALGCVITHLPCARR
uniref:Uncharacterized protein n=1 Tax=Trichuris muris TaxID=70415 RepID=A0A5S6Q7Q1_TRIMR